MALVLVCNAGSSSIKVSLVDEGRTILRTSIHAERAMDSVLQALAEAGVAAPTIATVGHRIVHGGTEFVAPVLVDDGVLATLDRLGELAPLHNRVGVEILRAARRAFPTAAHVACFDTAFHAAMPETVRRYPVPTSWHDEWGIRRYGFHGLSVAWASERAAALLGREQLAIVVAHLGGGASVTAVWQGVSVATSMGFTPLEGLMMGTRSGSIDPGILLHLLRTRRLEIDELSAALERGSGLRGVSGRSADVPELQAAATKGDAAAALALAMFVDRAAQGIAAIATALPRLDALVFTGGIGERAGGLRAEIVARLAVLGVPRIPADETGIDRVIANDGATAVLRIEAREDLVIARSALATV
jgi:acetate kinase